MSRGQQLNAQMKGAFSCWPLDINTLQALTPTSTAEKSTPGHPLTLQTTVRLVSSEIFRVRSESGTGYVPGQGKCG